MKDISLYEKHIDSPAEPILFNCYSVVKTLAPHWHEYIEILYFYSGEYDFFCNGETHKIKKNDTIIVNPAEIHSFTGKGDTKNHCILIHPSFFPKKCYDNVFIKNHIQNDDFIAECMCNLAHEAHNKPECWEMMVKSYAYSLMTYLYRTYNESDNPHLNYTHNDSKLRRLETVFNYIAAHYSENLTTNKLAEMCYLDTSYFCRFFKNATGKTVISYINEYRIEKAVFYLEATDETITKIANAVGFDDVNYFCRIFKKIKSITPAKYREFFHESKT